MGLILFLVGLYLLFHEEANKFVKHFTSKIAPKITRKRRLNQLLWYLKAIDSEGEHQAFTREEEGILQELELRGYKVQRNWDWNVITWYSS